MSIVISFIEIRERGKPLLNKETVVLFYYLQHIIQFKLAQINY